MKCGWEISTPEQAFALQASPQRGGCVMGFDAVDRAYAKPKPIQLECEACGGTDDDVRTRMHWYYIEEEGVLCRRCWAVWNPIHCS